MSITQAIGVDIGGTTIKAGRVNLQSGHIEEELRIDTPSSVAPVVDAVSYAVRQLLGSREIPVGVGVPGALNDERNMVLYPPNLIGWEEVPLRSLLGDALPGVAIHLDNDAKVATLAEAKLGAGRGAESFLMVTLGTGVGGGIWMSEFGSSGIIRGAGAAGEFGHLSIDHTGPLCGCGNRGCIEAYIGSEYLSKQAEEKLTTQPQLHSMLRGRSLTPEIISEAMQSGDEFARSVFQEAGAVLGIAMANVARLLDIRLFLLGGGISQAGELLFHSAQSSLSANVLQGQRNYVQVRAAHFGPDAGVIGAALLTMEDEKGAFTVVS